MPCMPVWHLYGIEGVVPGLHGGDELQAVRVGVVREDGPELPQTMSGVGHMQGILGKDTSQNRHWILKDEWLV